MCTLGHGRVTISDASTILLGLGRDGRDPSAGPGKRRFSLWTPGRQGLRW